MKTVLIVGSNTFGVTTIKKIAEQDNEITIVENNIEVKDNMRKQYLNVYQDLEPLLNISETIFYDKPKSKYHK